MVCEPEWRDVFQSCYARLPRKLPLKFAAPGAERQDSVANGFAAIDPAAQVGWWVAAAQVGDASCPGRSRAAGQAEAEDATAMPDMFSRRAPTAPPQLVAIHDSARPLVTAADTLQCCVDAWEVGGLGAGSWVCLCQACRPQARGLA